MSFAFVCVCIVCILGGTGEEGKLNCHSSLCLGFIPHLRFDSDMEVVVMWQKVKSH